MHTCLCLEAVRHARVVSVGQPPLAVFVIYCNAYGVFQVFDCVSALYRKPWEGTAGRDVSVTCSATQSAAENSEGGPKKCVEE
uniref:Uncharacterized protein n=1 Tax=Anguilla anguilla TaxID=7936 RepID=A0A0E9XWP1_ANGAN